MKEKVLAWILSGAMLFSIVPVPAFAQGQANGFDAEINTTKAETPNADAEIAALVTDAAPAAPASDGELPAPEPEGDTDLPVPEVFDLTVAGGAKDVDYSYQDGVITVFTQTELTISGTTTTDHIVIAEDVTANVILAGVNIDVSADVAACAFMVLGNVKITLADGTENILKSGEQKAGLQVEFAHKVTIEGQTAGTGKLHAIGGEFGAGIGGGNGSDSAGIRPDCGTVTIYGGTVQAESANRGAGIGGGIGGSGGIIHIHGGTVIAIGDANAGVGIGSGASGVGVNGGTLTITGGNVTATGGVAIGSMTGDGGTVTITGGNVTANGAVAIGSAYGNGGDVTVSGGVVSAIGVIEDEPVKGVGIGSLVGNPGTFSTGEQGTAILKASTIQDKTGNAEWGGIIFEAGKGTVYGDQTLSGDVTIAKDESLTINHGLTFTIPSGSTLTNHGTLRNEGALAGTGILAGDGTFETTVFTQDDMEPIPAQGYLGTEITPEVTIQREQMGQIFVGDTEGWSKQYTNNINVGTATVTLQKGDAILEQTFDIVRATTVFDGGVQTFKEGAGMATFLYGDVITVTVTPKATGVVAQAPTMAMARSFAAPTTNQMALFVGDTQVAEPQNVACGQALTFTIDTSEDVLRTGLQTIVAKYTGDSNMAAHEESVEITLLQSTGDFVIVGGEQGIDYSYKNNTVTVLTGTALTISGTTIKDGLVVQRGVTANITLNGVDITAIQGNADEFERGLNAISVLGSANITLAKDSVNTLLGGGYRAGLYIAEGEVLTIDGTGTLNTKGGRYGAGIGSYWQSKAGSIIINDGIINVNAGLASAALGEGGLGRVGDIIINGGVVTASSFRYSPAIGGEYAHSIITGGIVTAICQENGHGIGGTFSTGEDGAAIINTSSIEDQEGKAAAQAIIFEGVKATLDTPGALGTQGVVYGNPRFVQDLIIASGETVTVPRGNNLTIEPGYTLINHGTLDNQGTFTCNGMFTGDGVFTGDGALETDVFTINDIADIPQQLYNGKEIEPALVIEREIGGKLFAGSTARWTVQHENNLNAGTATIRLTRGEESIDLSFEIAMLNIEFDGGVQIYRNWDEATTEFSYGDRIRVKVTPKANGPVPVPVSDQTTEDETGFTAPALTQMALFVGETQVTAAQDSISGQELTFTIDTNDNRLRTGSYPLTVKYQGDHNITTCQEDIDITLLQNTGDFIVTGGEQGVDFSYVDATLTVLTSQALTILGTVKSRAIYLPEHIDANITLAGLDLYGAGEALQVMGTATITLADGTKNSLRGVSGKAALQVAEDATVTIRAEAQGTGQLDAQGGRFGAGIGGNNGCKSGDIIITGGVITASSPWYAAGIGNGNGGKGGNVTISGGVVTAIGGWPASDIGGDQRDDTARFSTGKNGNAVIIADDITDESNQDQWQGVILFDYYGSVYGNPTVPNDFTIKDGQTLTIPVGTSLTIGDGKTLTNEGVLINYGTLQGLGTATLAGDGIFSAFSADGIQNIPDQVYTGAPIIPAVIMIDPYVIMGKTFTLKADEIRTTYRDHTELGTATIDVTNGTITIAKHFDIIYETGDFTVTGGKPYRDYTYAEGTLKMLGDAPLTVSGATDKHNIVVEQDAHANITLAGLQIDLSAQQVACAFAVHGTAQITLADGTENTLRSGAQQAGLQTEEGGTLTILGETKGTGVLNATGGAQAAGIGGTITIAGGTVHGMGGTAGAGIGGAVTIRGGLVTATGGAGAPDIGGDARTGGAGSFTTGEQSGAVIKANTIQDQSNRADWNGVFVEANQAVVYGNSTLAQDFTIASDEVLLVKPGTSLFVPTGKTITNHGEIINNGTLQGMGAIVGDGSCIIDVLTPNDITDIPKQFYTGNPITPTITIAQSREILGKTFTMNIQDWVYRFSDNTALGTASVIFTRGSETVIKPFEIGHDTGDFKVVGGVFKQDYAYADGVLSILTGAPLTISGATTADRMVSATDITANITLAGVKVDLSASSDLCAFAVLGSANITLADGTENTLNSSAQKAGLQVEQGSAITITAGKAGTGTLHANGVVGIGSDGDAGNITISGGIVTATGQTQNAVGIGSATGRAGVFATGQNGTAFIDASGIQDHSRKASWNGVIFDGAEGVVYGNQTISHDFTIERNETFTLPDDTTLTVLNEITITNEGSFLNNGTLTGAGTLAGEGFFETDHLSAANIPDIPDQYYMGMPIHPNIGLVSTCHALGKSFESNIKDWDARLENNTEVGVASIIFTKGEERFVKHFNIIQYVAELTVTGGTENVDYMYVEGGVAVIGSAPITISGSSTKDVIIVPQGVNANITLNGVNIQSPPGEDFDIGVSGFAVKGTANVILADGTKNIFTGAYGQAGVEVCDDGILTISGQAAGTGQLIATAGEDGAGIGGSKGEDSGAITINSGIIVATGGTGGAGIGGGWGSVAHDITINGGTVTAIGGEAATGIGKGKCTWASEGSFSTGENGTAIIRTTSIEDQSQKAEWSGIIFENSAGFVYGNQTLSDDFTIAEGETLTVESSARLTIGAANTLNNEGTLICDGSLTGAGTLAGDGEFLINRFTEADIADLPSQPYTGQAITPVFTIERYMMNVLFTGNQQGWSYRYLNNIMPGTATVTLTKGEQAFTKTFPITGQAPSSVTITWGAMQYAYDDGTWNPETHAYENGIWFCADGANEIKIENNATTAQQVSLSYTSGENFSDIIGDFTNETAQSVADALVDVGEIQTFHLALSGKPTMGFYAQPIGHVTIQIGGE